MTEGCGLGGERRWSEGEEVRGFVGSWVRELGVGGSSRQPGQRQREAEAEAEAQAKKGGVFVGVQWLPRRGLWDAESWLCSSVVFEGLSMIPRPSFEGATSKKSIVKCCWQDGLRSRLSCWHRPGFRAVPRGWLRSDREWQQTLRGLLYYCSPASKPCFLAVGLALSVLHC